MASELDEEEQSDSVPDDDQINQILALSADDLKLFSRIDATREAPPPYVTIIIIYSFMYRCFDTNHKQEKQTSI